MYRMDDLIGRYKLKLDETVKQGLFFARYLWARVQHDRVNVNAGYLAYITLLSIVPMLTVLLSVLSSFAVFSNAGNVIQDFVITHFVPAAGDAVKAALTEFIANTGKMTAVGGLFLFVAALMLISNIDKNLNYIWRVHTKRRAVFSFSMYWMVLTLGPILVGASIAATRTLPHCVSSTAMHCLVLTTYSCAGCRSGSLSLLLLACICWCQTRRCDSLTP